MPRHNSTCPSCNPRWKCRCRPRTTRCRWSTRPPSKTSTTSCARTGRHALQAASSQDNSPEATAGRIVSFITNMFELYKKNNPDKEDASNVDDYMNLIFKGVDQGFKEARGILESLQVLQGDIASNIDKTYDLVQKSLNDFINKVKGGKPEGGDGEGSTDNGDGQGGTLVASETTVSISVSVSQTRISTSA
nr:DUF5610 domain-containing protein [Herbaspirillum sp. B65]